MQLYKKKFQGLNLFRFSSFSLMCMNNNGCKNFIICLQGLIDLVTNVAIEFLFHFGVTVKQDVLLLKFQALNLLRFSSFPLM